MQLILFFPLVWFVSMPFCLFTSCSPLFFYSLFFFLFTYLSTSYSPLFPRLFPFRIHLSFLSSLFFSCLPLSSFISSSYLPLFLFSFLFLFPFFRLRCCFYLTIFFLSSLTISPLSPACLFSLFSSLPVSLFHFPSSIPFLFYPSLHFPIFPFRLPHFPFSPLPLPLSPTPLASSSSLFISSFAFSSSPLPYSSRLLLFPSPLLLSPPPLPLFTSPLLSPSSPLLPPLLLPFSF